MKKSIYGAMLLSLLFILTSCIREESANAECDIVAVKATWLEANKAILLEVETIRKTEESEGEDG